MPAVAPLVEKGSDPQEPKGLSQEAAASRLVADGPNSLPATGQRGFWVMVLNIIWVVMYEFICGVGIYL